MSDPSLLQLHTTQMTFLQTLDFKHTVVPYSPYIKDLPTPVVCTAYIFIIIYSTWQIGTDTHNT